jgi:nitrogen fixation-related uncharacterized protein
MLYMLGGIVPLTTLWAVFSEGFFAGIVGLAASALALWTLGNDEFSDMIGAGERLFRARGILPPSAEEPQRQI